MTPGVFHLDAALKLETQGQVLLGIGMATLISAAGNTLIEVGDVDGVRVAGLLLDAGPEETKQLIKWGQEAASDAGEKNANGRAKAGADPTNPGVMSDIFVRVGGGDAEGSMKAEIAVEIFSDFVITDNIWLVSHHPRT